MSTVQPRTEPQAVPALFRHLVDDAAMFPPGDLPPAEALAAHDRHRQAPYRDLVGPFVCTDDQLTDVTVTAVEVRLRAEEDLSRNALRVVRACDDCMDEENAFIEIGLEGAWERALDVVADAGYAAKLRTGGLDRSLFPSASQVAAFITACLDREVPFKCTAGLHHAIRHTAPDTGFEHHGFLNVLLATRACLDGASHDAVIAVLEDRDGARLAAQARELSPEQAAGTRRWFTSFGSCSIDEPRRDLIDLDLLEDL
jgi:hypothetical protein